MRAKLFNYNRRYFVYNHVFFRVSLLDAVGPYAANVRSVIGCFNRGTQKLNFNFSVTVEVAFN